MNPAHRFSWFIILTGMLVLAAAAAHAVPAYPRPAEVAQPDGSTFQLQRHGDEYFSWDETQEGYAVQQDPADGYWKYARPATDRAVFDLIPEARVGAVDPAGLNLTIHAKPATELLKKQMEQRLPRGRTSSPTSAATSQDPLPTDTPGEGTPPLGIPVSGSTTIKNIVILASFSDHWNAGGGAVQATYGRTATSEYVNLFNQAGHANDGAVGSVRDYYNEVSYGKLTVSTVVTPWVRLPQTEAYYGANSGGIDIRPGVMTYDAIEAANAGGFDFSQGDSDGDGWVDCLTVIHSGYGEEYPGNPTNCIWSHQSEMSSTVTTDGVQLRRYHTEPALRGAVGTGAITRIGVVCHEMGHFFGLPDLYDYSDTTWGLGYWCLMAFGCWNGADGKMPAHFSAWPKCALGFAVPQLVSSQASASLARVEDNAVVHMIRDGTSNLEYFLVENRANYGFDNDTAAIFPGILIHHIDPKSGNNNLGVGGYAHPLVKIEEADGNNSLGGHTAKSQAGDVWHSTSGLTGGFRDQTGVQSANAMMYQTAAYDRTDNSAYYSYLQLSNFSAAGTPMTYQRSTLRPTVTAQTIGPPAPPNYTVSWGACTNAGYYEIQEGTAVSLNSFFDGAEAEDPANENWIFGPTVRRSTGGAHNGSYSYAMEWGASVQTLTMRNPFKLLAGTNLSFWVMSHLLASNGYLKCQISNDSGNTWNDLGAYSGYVDPWSQQVYNASQMTAAGVSINDQCIIRFVANAEPGSGWNWFPYYGYAVDDVNITGTDIASYGNWSTLNNNVPTTSYMVAGRPVGTYAYRVRAFANSTWQAYGMGAPVVVVPVAMSLFQIE